MSIAVFFLNDRAVSSVSSLTIKALRVPGIPGGCEAVLIMDWVTYNGFVSYDITRPFYNDGTFDLRVTKMIKRIKGCP